MRGRTVRLAAPVILAAGLVAGCGSSTGVGSHNQSSAPPKAELSAALGALGNGKALTMTFRLATTAADLIKIDHEHGDYGPDAIPTPVAKALTADHISIEIEPAGGQTVGALANPGGAKGGVNVGLTLGDDSNNYFSLLEVNKSLYAQLNLPYFLGVAGQPHAYAHLQQQVAGLPAFVRDFVAGKWVSLSYSTLQGIKGLAAGELQGLKKNAPSQSELQSLRSKLVGTLFNDLAVTRPTTGSTDHLVLTANIRTLLSDEFRVIKPFLDKIGGSFGASTIPTPDFSGIPSTTPHVDGYVTDGTLSKLSLDLGQFDTKVKYTLPLEVDFSTDPVTIDAPSASTPVDLGSLVQLFATATSSSSGGGTIGPTAVMQPVEPHT